MALLHRKNLFSKMQLQDWDLRGGNSRILVHFPVQTLNGITKMSLQCKNSFEAVKHQCLTQKALPMVSTHI